MTDGEALVSQAKAGSVCAFELLVRRDAPATYRLCYSILRSHHDAEEATQDAFVRAWRDLPRLREVTAWRAWLSHIAVRTSIDVARTVTRSRRSVYTDAAVAPDDAAAMARRQEVGAALMRISPEDRALLALRFYVDLELPQVAEALGIPLGTAKSRLHRTLNRIRPLLEDAHEG